MNDAIKADIQVLIDAIRRNTETLYESVYNLRQGGYSQQEPFNPWRLDIDKSISYLRQAESFFMSMSLDELKEHNEMMGRYYNQKGDLRGEFSGATRDREHE